jgi:DNA adenine methylase
VRYDGGKGAMGVAQWIINQLPPHSLYIEPFLGGGAVMRLKLPAGFSIGIERDARAVALWKNHGIPDLRIIHGDGISWLAKFARVPRPGALIYVDPPYLFSTRSGKKRIYNCELTERDHARLLSILTKLRGCSIAISGYWSEMYSRALVGWRATQFITTKRNHRMSEEWLWMNYPEPVALHDYRYLGANFRERERIKRKKLRWKRRLAAMSILERRALVATLAEVEDGRSCNGKNVDVFRRNCPNCNYAMYQADRTATSTIDVGIVANGDSSGFRGHRHSRRSAPAEII